MRQLLVFAACLATGVAHAATFTKTEVALDVPDGWVEVPRDVLQAFHAELQRQAPLAQVPKYDYAFQATGGPPWLQYPYVLVKVTPSGRPTERELEALKTIDLSSKVRERNDGWSDLLKNSSVGQMRYDKAQNVVWLTSKSEVKDVGPVTGISGIIPTEQGFLELHAYAKEGDFAQRLPTFQTMITGARVSPQLAYRPHWTDGLEPGGRFDMNRAAVTLAIGAAVIIFIVFLRRRKT
jgi:hypothetical protein